jgi:hypothetical protein
MIANIDADLVVYRCAATVPEHEGLDVATYRIDCLMRQILDATESTSYNAYLTGKGNFRKKINPLYKANRKDTVPPFYLQECRAYLMDEWNGIMSEGCEADDLLGINMTSDSICCSLDKDLRMIPGKHFNWVKMEYVDVNQQDALRFFYKQMLIGDKADNIIGVNKIGPVKAEKLIEHLDDEQEMFETVYNLYNDPQRFVMNANCLWIQREEGDSWGKRQSLALPQPCELEVIAMLDYMTSLNQDTSTEPITTET